MRDRWPVQRPPLIVSWISALIVLGVVVYGWAEGRPLTADVIVVLGAFWSWAVRTSLWSHRQLAEHDAAVRQIAAATGQREADVRRMYDEDGDLRAVLIKAAERQRALAERNPRP